MEVQCDRFGRAVAQQRLSCKPVRGEVRYAGPQGRTRLPGIAYRLCNEVCIFAVGCVPIASIEYSNRLFINGWEGLEEADEATLVFELEKGLKRSKNWDVYELVYL